MQSIPARLNLRHTRGPGICSREVQAQSCPRRSCIKITLQAQHVSQVVERQRQHPVVAHRAGKRRALFTDEPGPCQMMMHACCVAMMMMHAALTRDASPRPRVATTAGSRRTAPSGASAAASYRVAGLVAQAYTNREIYKRLDISERTAEKHVQNILSHLE